MISTAEVVFERLNCVRLSNDLLTVWITTDVGPRILGLSLAEGENLFVVSPEARIPVKGQGDYSLRGGHRLWYAPEIPETTYITDDKPVEITLLENGAEVIQEVDEKTGIQKSIKVILSEELAQITIDHKLLNTGRESFRLAPWAITMMRTGGLGMIPLQTKTDDENGLWPNRDLVLWPYTKINSPHINLRDRAVAIKAEMAEGALKVGASNPLGWLAYSLDGTLFVKKTAYQAGANYLDRGASSQIYCNPNVIELESLGPVVDLGPGECTTHQEIWQVYPEGSWPEEISDLLDIF